jgi:hypothetical protein
MNSLFKQIKELKTELDEFILPNESTVPVLNGRVIPFSVVRGTRGYIEKITHQINGTYVDSNYDACAVMIRRLIETLIIETFEHNGLSHLIENGNGNYFFLKDLIDVTLSQSWKLSRNFKKDLLRFKDVGDKSAHSKTYIANRQDIDDIIPNLRLVIQELLILSGIKR